MAGAIAEPLRGVFLVPGVSKNKRLYTKEMIAKAVARMQARIADPDGLPISMRTSHGAGDRSELIVARVVGVKQLADGRATYEARWYDTRPARDIAELVRPKDGGAPGLRSVSIHGWFIDPKRVEYQGESLATSSDLEIDNIDFTGNPGVVKALIDPPDEPTESAPTRPGYVAIYETWENPMPETDAGAALPVVDEAYTAAQKRDALKAGQAMRNADGKPSYTIKNKSDLRRAIRAVGRGGADHNDIRKHVMDRAAALGLSAMIPDAWNKDGSLKESAGIRFGEIRECYGDGPSGAGFAIDAYNGPISLTLRAPNLDPGSLRAVAAAAVGAAMDALGALDPDFDADIDIPGAPAEDADDDMVEDLRDADTETPDGDEAPEPGSGCPCGCGCAVPDEMAGGPGCPCACGCEICHAAVPESVQPATGGPARADEAVLVSDDGPELFIPAESGDYTTLQTPGAAEPTPAPEPAPETSTPKESAVSETTPAAEAATPTPAAPVNIVMSPEQFTQLLAAVRPPVAETAPAQAPVAAAAPVEQPATPAPAPALVSQPAAEQAPATAEVAQIDIGETVKAAVDGALARAIPALRDAMVSQYGLPPRIGIRTSETDTNASEMSPDQLWTGRADLLLGNVGKAAA